MYVILREKNHSPNPSVADSVTRTMFIWQQQEYIPLVAYFFSPTQILL